MSCWAMNSVESELDLREFYSCTSSCVSPVYIFLCHCVSPFQVWTESVMLQRSKLHIASLQSAEYEILFLFLSRTLCSFACFYSVFYFVIHFCQSFPILIILFWLRDSIHSCAYCTLELRLALRMHPDKAHQNGMCAGLKCSDSA